MSDVTVVLLLLMMGDGLARMREEMVQLNVSALFLVVFVRLSLLPRLFALLRFCSEGSYILRRSKWKLGVRSAIHVSRSFDDDDDDSGNGSCFYQQLAVP